MDEQTLNIILECPVCLNTFTETSRVLPCQHTFCYECLEDIVAKRGVLHCPECRAMVTTLVADLPRNILLMRLLSGLQTKRHSHHGMIEHSIQSSHQQESSSYETNTTTTANCNNQRIDTSKSCPSTPLTTAYTASSFPLFFPRVHRNSLPSDQSPVSENPPAETTHTPRGFNRILRRSPSDLREINERESTMQNVSNMRTSRTSTDLAGLAGRYNDHYNSPLSGEFSSIHNMEDRYLETTTTTASSFSAPTPVTFSFSSWIQQQPSPRNVHDPSAEYRTSYFSNVTRTASNPIDDATTSALRNRRLARKENPDNGNKSMMEIILANQSVHGSGLPTSSFRNGSRSSALQASHEVPPPPKETKSFIKCFFRSHKNNDAHIDTSAKNRAAQQQPDNKNNSFDKCRSGVCLTSLRSSSRNSKQNFECYRCIVPYPAKNQYELDLRMNDLLYVHQKHSDGWLKATHERTGRNGLIPVAFVERLHGSIATA